MIGSNYVVHDMHPGFVSVSLCGASGIGTTSALLPCQVAGLNHFGDTPPQGLALRILTYPYSRTKLEIRRYIVKTSKSLEAENHFK